MNFFKNYSKSKFLIFWTILISVFFVTCKSKTDSHKLQTTFDNYDGFKSKAASENYDSAKIDIENSKLYWIGKKIYEDHRGTINIANGTVFIKDNQVMEAYLKVDMNSIKCTDIENETYNHKLVEHLKNEDFFEVNTHPYAEIFLNFNLIEALEQKKSTYINQSYNANGEIVIKGIKQEISNNFLISYKNNRFSTIGEVEIDRTDFNIQYKSGKFFPELADKVILDDFTIKFELNTE